MMLLGQMSDRAKIIIICLALGVAAAIILLALGGPRYREPFRAAAGGGGSSPIPPELEKALRPHDSSRMPVQAIAQNAAPASLTAVAAEEPDRKNGCSIRGVVRYEDRTPANGAVVSLGSEELERMQTTWTDENGSFLFRRVHRGQFFVAADDNRSATKSESKDVACGEDGPRPASIELTLPTPTLSIAGIVVEQNDDPVFDATVTAFEASDKDNRESQAYSTFSARTMTSSDGRFVLDRLGAGSFRVSAERRGHIRVVVSGVRAGERNLKIVLPAGGSISGRVVLANGEPATDFFLFYRVLPRHPHSFGGAWLENTASEGAAISSLDGSFRLEGLHAGTYDLLARTARGSAMQKGIALAAGEKREGIVLALAEGGSISGHIVDALKGDPIAGALVRVTFSGDQRSGPMPLGAFETHSAEGGAFTLGDVPAGEWALAVSYKGYLPKRLDGVAAQPGEATALGEIKLLAGDMDKLSNAEKFGGVGIAIEKREKDFIVASVLPNGPANRLGIKTGDKIKAVDSVASEQMDITEATARIRGQVGTPVTLDIEREGQIMRIAVIREEISK